jgi:hypothetical protein
MAQFVKIGNDYLNLDLVRGVEPRVNNEGAVEHVRLTYSNGDHGELKDEDARALVAAIDPPKKDAPGWGLA